MRLGVYTDFPYRRDESGLHGEQAFSLFLGGLRGHCDRLVLIGREDPRAAWSGFALKEKAEFVALPFYTNLAGSFGVARVLCQSLRRFWRALDDLDAVWLMGPHPIALAFALVAMARGRTVVLGVRQHLPSYVTLRYPDRALTKMIAWGLEFAFRALAVFCPTVVVGPDLARGYQRFRDPLVIAVSLIEHDQVVSPEEAARDYEGELIAVSVGRLDPEKNPLLLAEVLAVLRDRGENWRLEVCGDGRLRDELQARLDELGLRDHAALHGNVPFGPALAEVYERGHVFLHVSWTEGFPQVLLEAFASGLPVVATDVGGVRAMAAGAARLIPPGDPGAAADALACVAADSRLRDELVRKGVERVGKMTLSHEAARVAEFIDAARNPAIP